MADETITIDVTGNADKYARSLLDTAKASLTLERAQLALDKAGAALSAVWDRVIVRQIEARREIDRLADSSQLAERTIAGLRLAAQQAGQSVDDIVPIDLADRLRDLQDGTQSIVDDFGLLGLAAEDFVGLNLDQSFALISDRLATVASDTDRAAAATRLFGGNGERLISVISGGSDELERYAKAASEVGAGSAEAAEAAREWGASLAALNLALEETGSELATLLSSVGVPAAIESFGIGLVFAVNAARQAISELVAGLGDLASFDLSTFAPSEIAARFQRIFGAGYDGAQSYYGALKAGAEDTEGFLEPTRREVAATTEALEGGTRTAYDFGAALRELSAISMDALSSQLTAEQQIGEAYDARLGSIQAVIDAAREQGATAEEVAELELRALGAVTAAESERDQSLLEVARERSEAEQEAIERLRKAREVAHEEALRQAQEQAAADAARKAATEAAAQDLVSVTAQAASGLASLLEDSGRRYRGAALAAFRAAQATAIAQAVVNAALAASQGLAAAPPPLSFALAAANAAAGAVQVATIASAPPPRSLHIGSRAGDLAPDEARTTITRREVVLTPQGAANANAGVRPRDAGQSVTLVQIGHQVVGRAAAEAVVRPDSLLRRSIGRDVPGHSRRRT